MKFESLDGKEVESISWVEPDWGYRRVFSGERAYLSSEYYGDHTENWVIWEKDGKETHRYNTKYIDCIKWKEK